MQVLDQPVADVDRWTPDDVAFRDATREGGARGRVEREQARFVDGLRDLGFRELGISGSRFQSQLECVPEVSEQEVRELAERAEAEERGADDKLEWARKMRGLHTLWRSDHLTWTWAHPDTGDVALLEHTDENGDWLSFRRLHDDGTLVRTVRRPDGIGHGAPAATGIFVDAPLPGLYRLMCRLGGDQFLVGKGPKPALRQYDHSVDGTTPAETYAAHLANVRAVGPIAPAATPSMPLVLALSRRTLHVTLEGLARAGRLGRSLWTGVDLAGRAAVAVLVGVATGSVLTGLVASVLLSWAAGACWGASTGCSRPTVVLAPIALTLFWAWRVGVTPALLGAAFAVALTAEVAGRLAFFWLGQAGRARLDRSMSHPPPLTPDELLRHYPE